MRSDEKHHECNLAVAWLSVTESSVLGCDLLPVAAEGRLCTEPLLASVAASNIFRKLQWP